MESHKKTSKQQLPSLIWSKLIPAMFDSNQGSPCKFFPEDQYSEVLTSDGIATYLWRETDPQVAASDAGVELVRWIHEKAKRVFAIVAVLKLSSSATVTSMRDFKNGVLDDAKLPIPEYDTFSAPNYFDADIWDDLGLAHFHDYQWRFLAPIFAKKYRYDLEPYSIFPFVEVDEASTRSGAFSSVYKVTIHDRHTCDSYPRVWLPNLMLHSTNS
jgi:hypothetical protein